MNRRTLGPLVFVIAALLAATIAVVPSLASPTPQTSQNPESGTRLDKPRGALGFLDHSNRSGRQGGENWGTATPIPELPSVVTGTTCGYDPDCGGYCGGFESLGSDVVYSYVATADTAIALDACDSSFDTMVFVWDEELNLVACNNDRFGPIDDCGQYTSRIERAPVEAGALYYIVVTGWYGCGDYILEVGYYEPCELECTGMPEGEPALHDGYVDMYNGGCNNGEAFQHLAGEANGNLAFCGTSGWYESPNGSNIRDRDWLVVTLGPSGILEWALDSERWTLGRVVSPTDCNDASVVAGFESGYCGSGDIVYYGQPGEVVWLVILPGRSLAPPHFIGHEYIYVCTFSGLQASVAVEQRSWSAVKGLFTEPRERYGKRARE